MKKEILSAVFLIPVLTGSLNAQLGRPYPEERVVVLAAEDLFDPDQKPLAKLKAGGAAPSESAACTYGELLAVFRRKAREENANLVKITLHKARDRNRSCEYAEAALYRVEDPGHWETRFSWSRGRLLEWSDFRGVVPEGRSNTAAETACGFGFETGTVSGDGAVQVSVYNAFSTEKSWVRPDARTPEVLQHEQGHFDLCELYTRRFRERLSRIPLTGSNMKDTLGNLYRELQQEYLQRQDAYERETRHGLDESEQRRWTLLISEELKATELWASQGEER